MELSAAQKNLVEKIKEIYPNSNEFRLKDLKDLAGTIRVSSSEVDNLVRKMPRVSRGIYDFTMVILPFKKDNVMKTTESVKSVESIQPKMIAPISEDVFIPQNDSYYVRWGNHKDVESIIKSGVFYPVFITGLSGNGKTTMVEQACAKLKKNYMRVQITPETDEDDLIGGFRLLNGETVFAEGPVIRAMKSGALLLLDEIDRGSNRIMCLQSVLEGKPVLIKKTGEVVHPVSGFNIMATANTKGKGSDDGRFIAATIMDEAFLERFTITMEQQYPTASVEKKIVLKHMAKYGKTDEEFADKLVVWSEAIRKTFVDGGVDELISTRRLCHISQTFAIFNDKMKSIKLCIARFDDDTKEAFLDLYTKIDSNIDTSLKTTEINTELNF
tara:strand:+ start:16379 stop:17533 length:1155 start_codon:yes stop_codon:yes gene_type:complete